MPLVKPQANPGFLSQATQVQARGNWFDGNLVRWRLGLLEKIGGWRRLIEEQLPAMIRRMHGWLDLDNRKNLLIGADDGVHILVQDTLYGIGRQTDLQGGYIPVVGAGPSTKFSVTIGSTEVTVSTTEVAVPGGTFLLRIGISIGERVILGGAFFTVKAIVPGGFTFDMPVPALVTETDTYGIPLLENNIVNGFTVTWKAHGFSVGSQYRVAQDTTIRLGVSGTWAQLNFSAPSGTVGVVDTVVDADHFTFKMGTLGTGDGLGGTSHQIFVGSLIEQPTEAGSVLNVKAGNVIGLANMSAPGNPQKLAYFLANLGEDGLVLVSGGPLEVYKPPIQDGPFLNPVADAPQKSNGMLTAMPQAQVILWGSEAEIGHGVIDPLMIRWSDAGSYSVYIATVSNQAGSYRLSRGSRIVGAIQAPQATLIFTDTDVWQMSYIGPPLIYGFTIMGSGCGLVAPHAVATVGRTTIWQGQRNFWQFDTGIQPVPCTVWDYIFDDIDPLNVNKCHAAPNSTTNEMAFYFASQHTMIDVDRNLLLFSQLFSDPHWVPINAQTVPFLQTFRTLYVYEPQYVKSAWFDGSGMASIAWWDHDVQGEPEKFIFAPDGTGTAFLLFEDATNGTHSIDQTIDKAGEEILYTFSIYVQDNSTRNLTLRAVTDLGSAFATFDVVAGNLLSSGVTSSKFTFVKATVLTDKLATGRPSFGPPGNGWRRYVLTFKSDDSETLDLFLNLTKGLDLSYQGEPPKGALIWGAQLVLGAEPLDYQQTEGIQRQNETRRYVKVNLAEGMAWDSGRLPRTAWLDESVWGTPLGADGRNNCIQQHEIGHDDDDEPMRNVFAETGFTELGDGTAIMMVDECHPDLKWFGYGGAMKLFIKGANWPQGPIHSYGPFSLTPTTKWFTPRVRARYAALRYEWEPRLGFSARIGLTTFHVKPTGKMP